MRIVHIDTDDIENPLRGGQPVRTFEINSRISKQHEVTVFTASYPDSKREVTRGNIHYRRLGCTIPRFGLSSHLSFLTGLPWAIKHTPHDLIVEEFMPPFGFCGAPIWSNKPVISMVQWFFFDDWQKRYKLPFEKIMTKLSAHLRYRDLIVQTDKMGDFFLDLMPHSRIHKIPCGITADAFNLTPSLGDYALYLGRLDIHHKGLDYLIESWSRMVTRGIHIPLYIVGAGPGEAYLKQEVTRLGLQSLVTLKGRVEGPEKQQLLKQCRLLVMPSRQETFGLTALEAMAAAKPVVAFDIDHLNEVVKPQWGRLSHLANVEDFVRNIVELWQSPDLVMQLGHAAIQEAKAYQWDVIAEKQLKIYQEVINRG